MKLGIHTIRSGFSTTADPVTPRRYSLDNSNFELNMRILNIDIIAGVDPGQLDMGNAKILFVVATTEAGATPQALVGDSDTREGFQFRFDDNSQIAWGAIEATQQPKVILDPGHIIPEDLYINAWTMTTGGSPNQLLCPMSFLITMVQVENTGAEALLYQIKESLS